MNTDYFPADLRNNFIAPAKIGTQNITNHTNIAMTGGQVAAILVGHRVSGDVYRLPVPADLESKFYKAHKNQKIKIVKSHG